MVRNLQALEALSQVDAVVFDKTGTLTRDAMVLGVVRTREGVTGAQALQMAAALAKHSLHPVSRALCAAALQDLASGALPWMAEAVTETPGQGVSGLAHAGGGAAASTASAHIATLRLGSASFCGVNDPDADTLRVYLRDAHGWVASFSLEEALRAQALAAVQALRAAQIQVHRLSGDSQESVGRIASSLGLVGGEAGSLVRAACSPADKLRELRSLQHAGRKVAMVGDGLNDGPVLAGAHVSFAFGNAVPLAQAKSDFVVLGDQLMAVVGAVLMARKTMAVVRQNLWWALLYNAACVPLALLGWLPAWLAGLGMAASSLLVVLNALRLAQAKPVQALA